MWKNVCPPIDLHASLISPSLMIKEHIFIERFELENIYHTWLASLTRVYGVIAHVRKRNIAKHFATPHCALLSGL